MSFSISGIFKPAKQTESVSQVTQKALETNSVEAKTTTTETSQKKQGNGGSCCGGCGGAGH
ncbi:CCGSCS motif protein [Shewanella sp. MF05960]|uniref:CCGSCS motif protein n=1 Tax=Shewanella sp. MF05960 TaxID=3434874 RepID=UPI003D7A5431